jgi:integrase
MSKFDCRFQLKHPNAIQKSEIRLRISFNYEDFVWNVKDSLGRVLKIYPQLWDTEKQYPIPKGKIPSKFQNETYNLQIICNTIDNIKVFVNQIINDLVLGNTKITKDLLRDNLLIKMGLTEKKREITIYQFCLNTIKEMEDGILLIESTKRYTKSTIDKYKYTAQILEVFKPNTTFPQIDKIWYKDFILFLTTKQSITYKDKESNEKLFEKRELQPGSIANYVKNLKFLMGHAVETGISTNKNHSEKWFLRPKEQPGFGNIHIALNEGELKKLYDFNPAKIGLNRTYEIAKDLFLVGCYTGLRVSDFNSGLSAKDFTTVNRNGKEEKVLIKPTQKTGSISYTPAIWEELQKIFEKYNYQLPVLSDNTIRKYTQKICENIKGFDESKSWYITLGGKTEKIEKSKWQMVGNHTGRRSFITNLKRRGYSFDDIGEFTGQTTIAVIKEYDKTPKEENVINIKEKHERQ